MATQFFKALYFNDFPSNNSKERSLTLAFSITEMPVYTKIKDMSTQEIKDLIRIDNYPQVARLAENEERSINQTIKRLIKQNLPSIETLNGTEKRDVTFKNSKELPFQRWYPYIEGYSIAFVESLINEFGIANCKVYDPFVGTGTTLFACDKKGLTSAYSEVNPLLQYLIDTKLRALRLSQDNRTVLAKQLSTISKTILQTIDGLEIDVSLLESYKVVFGDSVYFSDVTKEKILKLRTFIDLCSLENPMLASLVTIATVSCLLPVSYLKKAGDVRFKTVKELERELRTLEDTLPIRLSEIAEDLLKFDYCIHKQHEFLVANAKNISRVEDQKFGAVITSPPYLNGTNYFRNTKLELWFLRYLESPDDLRHFRDQALTSGINDVKKSPLKKDSIVFEKSQILTSTFRTLKEKAYDVRIPAMVQSYFEEMFSIFSSLKKHLTNGATILIDIGDSIFADVHIKTDEILVELMRSLGYQYKDNKILRKRRSRNKEVLTQSLIVFTYSDNSKLELDVTQNTFAWKNAWTSFKRKLPHQELPYSKRNWGHPNHSLCSYQGKLKPSIAHHLVKAFVPDGGTLLDPFAGVGTVPFEGSLSAKKTFGMDISLPAYYISSAKISRISKEGCNNYIDQLEAFIKDEVCSGEEISETKRFGFNKKLVDYYHPDTLKEILLARRFIKSRYPKNANEMAVVSSLLHILHGNRPYALSRNSHPIIPYAPTGEFSYRSVVDNLREKVQRITSVEVPENFIEGKMFWRDSTAVWPQEINNLDAVITSPPFFDSTRFYLANWIRLWFSGWNQEDFKFQPNSFLDEKQKTSFSVYESIFRQSKERLKQGGVCVLHLGKSSKCDMAAELNKISRKWFRKFDLFTESVEHCESHGIRDKGTVTSHQYLVLT